MKYYYLITISFNDDTKDSVAVYTYDDLDTAKATYHTQHGSWMKKENTDHILSLVTSEKGGIFVNDSWYRPKPEFPAKSERIIAERQDENGIA